MFGIFLFSVHFPASLLFIFFRNVKIVTLGGYFYSAEFFVGIVAYLGLSENVLARTIEDSIYHWTKRRTRPRVSTGIVSLASTESEIEVRTLGGIAFVSRRESRWKYTGTLSSRAAFIPPWLTSDEQRGRMNGPSSATKESRG